MKWMGRAIVPVVALVFACNGGDKNGTNGGSGPTSSSSSTGGAGSGTGGVSGSATGGDGSGGDIGAISSSTGTGGGTPVSLEEAGIAPRSLPPLPQITCDPAGSGAECTLPQSVCADYSWLVFYTEPACVRGLCTWTPKALMCQPPDQCIDAACEYNFTA